MLLEELILDEGYLSYPFNDDHNAAWSRMWVFPDEQEARDFSRESNMTLRAKGGNYMTSVQPTLNGMWLVFSQFVHNMSDFNLSDIQFIAFSFDKEACEKATARALEKMGAPKLSYIMQHVRLSDYEAL